MVRNVQVASENTELSDELHAEQLAADAAVKQVNLSVTSAASPFAYQVLAMIASGEVFGCDVEINLKLCDADASALSAVAMEVVDLASGSVRRPPSVTSDPTQFFAGADVILLLDDVTALECEPRADWLQRVYNHFADYARHIDAAAARSDIYVIIPAIAQKSTANFIATVISRCAPNTPPENIIVPSRLVENRAKAAISRRAGVNAGSIVDLVVWGDPSAATPDRFAVDITSAKVFDCDHSAVWGPQHCRSVETVVGDDRWLQQALPAAIASSSSSSSFVATAGALTSFLSDWWTGNSSRKRFHSVAVMSQG